MTTPVTSTAFFTPRSITGLSGWYDGNDPLGTGAMPSNGFPISQWSDKSGNANHAIQGVTSNQPYFSNTGIIFSGTQNLNFTNPNALVSNTTFSIFIVEQRASSSNTNYIFAGSINAVNQNLHIGYNSSTTLRVGYYGNDLDYAVPTYSAGNEPFRMWCITQSNTGREISLNGSFGARNGNTTLLQSWNGGSIGRNFFGAGTPYYLGAIEEIIFYKPSLAIAQQQQIEGYLAWKYSLQRSLSLTHPYFNNPQESVYPYTLLRAIPQPKINVPAWSVFNPLSIASCSLWLDSSSSNNFTLSNTSNVVQWNDKSGNGKHFTTIVGIPRFISPSQGVFFNGTTADCMQSISNISYTAGITSLFVVTRITGINSGSAYVIVFGNATDFSLRYTNGGAGNGNDIFNTRSLFYNGASQGIFSIPVAAFSNTSLINGIVNITNSTVIQLSLGTVPVGGGGHSNRYLTGFIQEVLIYSTLLTATQRQQVEAYLTYKWSLQPSLVVSHPAKNNFLYKLLPGIPAGVSAPATINTTGRFAPTSLSGLSLWLDAADTSSLSLSNTSVTQWRDKSGNGKNAVISGTVTYNNPNVITNGVSPNSFSVPVDIRRSNVPNLNIFIVYNQINTSSPVNQGLYGNDFNGGWNRFQLLNNNGPFDYRVSAGFLSGSAQVIPVTTINNTNRLIYNASYSLSNINGSFVFLNGNLNATFTEYASQTETTTSNIFFGTINSQHTFGNVVFNEIIIFSRTITTTERQQIEGYLAWKWGFCPLLPPRHPNICMPS